MAMNKIKEAAELVIWLFLLIVGNVAGHLLWDWNPNLSIGLVLVWVVLTLLFGTVFVVDKIHRWMIRRRELKRVFLQEKAEVEAIISKAHWTGSSLGHEDLEKIRHYFQRCYTYKWISK